MHHCAQLAKRCPSALACPAAPRAVLLIDDLIATGHTLARAARALRHAGARRVIAWAAHGLFVDEANAALADESIETIVVCDSVPPLRVTPGRGLRAKLRVCSSVPVFSGAIRDSHSSWHN